MAPDDTDTEHPMPSLADHLSADETKELLEETTVTVNGDERTLDSLMEDIAVAHRQLDNYKQASLTISSAIDERMIGAEMDEDTKLYAALQNLKKSTFAVYLRLNRGDAELTGERDGKYSGYFADDDD